MAQEELGLITDHPMEPYPMIQLFAIGNGLLALVIEVALFQIMVMALVGVAAISWKQM